MYSHILRFAYESFVQVNPPEGTNFYEDCTSETRAVIRDATTNENKTLNEVETLPQEQLISISKDYLRWQREDTIRADALMLSAVPWIYEVNYIVFRIERQAD